jgi:hypothetical protein
MISKSRFFALVAPALLVGIFLLPVLMSSSPAPPQSLEEILDKVAGRLASYPEPAAWKAEVLSTSREMDSKWQPKKTTVINKTVTMRDKVWTEDILSAVESEDGKEKDVTRKYRDDALKRAEKQRRRSAPENKEDERRRGRRSMDMDRDDLLPFLPGMRGNHDFFLRVPATLEGRQVLVLQSKARERSLEAYEGLYFIDPETFDVRRVELSPSKTPGPLKRLDMEIDFRLLPEGHLVIAKAKMRIHIGLVIKNYRIEAVEEYRSYEMLDRSSSTPPTSPPANS